MMQSRPVGRRLSGARLGILQLGILPLATLPLGLALAGPAHATARHALIVGANQGGELEPLRYAESDAQQVADVLAELGGFSPNEITVLSAPDRAELSAALDAHAVRAAAAPHDLFVFYYSGHADAQGLRLGDERVSYSELRESIRATEAEITLGVLDACRSGEITRLKGVTVSAPFATEGQLSAEGEVWLTASSADEAAQESDRLGGSFFTHYLVSGLRGAADAGDVDGRVSLSEAYAYAYDRTVARTGGTDAGSQHPGYDFRLQGSGDLTLTDVEQARARVRIPKGIAGELTVLRLPEQTPTVEIAKLADEEVTVALPPGHYLLRHNGPDGVQEARIGLGEGADLEVRGFVPVGAELAMTKGAPEGRVGKVTAWAIGMGDRSRQMVERLADDGRGALRHGDAETQVALGLDTVDLICRAVGPECLSGKALADGRVVLRHPNGEVAARGEIQSGVPVGRWDFRYDDGVRHSTGEFLGGQRIGGWSWWYPSGHKMRKGEYVDGRSTGTWTDWYDDGPKASRVDYAGGEPAGEITEWYDNGEKRLAGRQMGAQRLGRWTEWYDNGKKKTEGVYDSAGRRGGWTTWYPDGGRESRGEYVADTLNGSWVAWYPDGSVAEKGRYDDGRKVGKWIFWSESGERRRERF